VNNKTKYDAVIVGAGFAGMYMLFKLRKMGLSVLVFEAGADLGGTWYWNRYPGARCDVESMQYSYQFDEELQQEWEWSERYATQPEILKYIDHVAKKFNLRSDIRFNTKVTKAFFDEKFNHWRLETDDGEKLIAQYCIMATGCLSSVNKPDIKGKESFSGSIYYTGEWPHKGVDLGNKRVGIIGTGSSAIQSIPVIAKTVDELTVFQRTANYAVPAHNKSLNPDQVRKIKDNYAEFRAKAKLTPTGNLFEIGKASVTLDSDEEREKSYEERWQAGGLPFLSAYADVMFNAESNRVAADFVRNKIREIVNDRVVADLLSPKNIIGCKRLCVDTGYYEAFNKDNVKLIDISKSGIDEICGPGIRIGKKVYELDVIIFATGFDAMTGALLNIDIRGKKDLPLKEKWSEGPRSYLGVALAGFPNLFMITGPGSPSVISNMLPAIEQHVDWITECISYMRNKGFAVIDAQNEAEEEWISHVRDVADMSLRSTCNSWYVGANIPGKPRIYMPYIGGVPVYAKKCKDVASAGYEGFALT